MVSTVYIAKNVYGADGLGRLGDGRVVFVVGAFAGEQVKAEIIEEKRHFVRARLVEVVERSPERIGEGEMPIPGMVYANLSREGEIAAKTSQLEEALTRAFRRQFQIDKFIPSKYSNYRNNVVYHFAIERGKLLLGYKKEPENTIQDILEDPLAVPEINAKLGEIRRHVFSLLTQGSSSVRKAVEGKENVTIRYSKISGVKWWLGAAPKDGIIMKESSCGKIFEVPADGFWQVNSEVGEELAKEVARAYRQNATTSPDILDLYCGVGVLGLSTGAERVTGIESGRRAVEFAKKNAAAQGASGARFFAQEVGRNLHKLRIYPTTTIILDPPRGGLEKGVAKYLSKSRAKRIIYVSCDPATLTRDLVQLEAGYQIETVKWFDMFPRTARFETMVTLKKREKQS